MTQYSERKVLKDQIESLQAALIAKEEVHKLTIKDLKHRAIKGFIECEDIGEFEKLINEK